MTFDLENAKNVLTVIFQQQADEIERLRADNAGLSESVIRIQEERDLAQAEFRAYHRAWEDGAARIKELDGMLDARSKEIVGRIQECQACQIDQLRAEGKIGPGVKPRSWQITDGRVRAIQWAEEMAGDCKAGNVLQGMLQEAGQ